VVPVLSLFLYGVYLALAFGLRVAIQLRRTGSTGVRGMGESPAERVAGGGFVLAVLLGAAAPVLALLGWVEPISALDTDGVHVVGAVLALLGIAGTFYAQLAMGNSWRIGVDAEERTELVTAGPFAYVRNPIYSAMIPTALGLALLVPSWVALVGCAGLAIALEVQVRLVEEPYLLRAHAAVYASYAARVGRFAPGVGRIRAGAPAS
jgi:protein-S-isoprenylcysteine O-methyltransferase Ste14